MAKILIIEDEKAMSDLIAIKFNVESFEVDQAGSLADARSKLASAGPYDAVLTDYLMPDGDLVEFLTDVRNNPKLAKVPIVVMTNYFEDLNVEKLKSLGVVDVLVKYQVVPAQMVERIKKIIGGGGGGNPPAGMPPVGTPPAAS